MRNFLIILSFMLLSNLAFAETVKLKSGVTLEGEIIESTDDYVVLDRGKSGAYKLKFDQIEDASATYLRTLPKVTRIKPQVIVPAQQEVQQDVVQQVSAADTKESESFEHYYELGKTHSDKKEYEEAIQYFEKARILKPEDYNVLYYLGELNIRSGKEDVGIDYLKKAAEIEPNKYAVNMTLGTRLFEKGQIKDALPYFEKCIEIEPARDASYIALATAHNRLGNSDKAVEYLKKDLEVNPNQVTTNVELAKLYQVDRNDPKSALPYAQKATELKESGEAYLVLGSIYFQLRQREPAKEALKKAIDLLKTEGNERGYQSALGLYNRF